MPEPESFKQRQLEFYKESYVAENDKKEKLRGGVAFNLGVFTVLANVFVSVFDSMQRFEHSKLFWWFCVVVAISLFLGLVALYFLFRALGFPKGYEYGYVPKTTEMYKFIKSAEQYNAQVDDAAKMNIEEEFENILTAYYNGFASRNADCNKRRMRFVFLSLKWSLISAVVLFISLPMYYWLRFQSPSPVQAVDISKPIRIQHERQSQP